MAGTHEHQRLGLNQVYPQDGSFNGTLPAVDIVAIHGLDTRSPRTWIAYETEDQDGPRGRAVNWLSDDDMLPDIIPEVRVFTYDYNANYHAEAPVETLLGHADTLLKLVNYQRQQDRSTLRPLIFIASCFGGLILVEALNRAAQTESPHHGLLQSTAGVVFLASPLRGSRAAPAARWRIVIAGIMGGDVSDTLVRDLDAKTGVLEHLVRIFAENANASWLRLPVHCFYETRKTEILRSLVSRDIASFFSTPFTKMLVSDGFCKYRGFDLLEKLVDQESACIQGFDRTGLNASHALMNKFRGPKDPNFKLVASCLRNLVDKASGVLNDRKNSLIKLDRGEVSANVHWLVPRAVNTGFVGRTEILTTIKNAIRNNQKAGSIRQQQRFVITGMGGQGKSEICLKIADMVRHDFWGIFWVDVSTTSLATSNFISVAKLLGSSAKSIDDVLQLLANAQKSWLLILDNADDPHFDYQVYFPSGTWGTIIMTTRVSECDHYQTIGAEELQSLDQDDCLQLLFKAAKIPLESWSLHGQAAKEIMEILSHHTLALIQAGAYIARRHCSMKDYPGIFQRQRERLLKFSPKQAQSRYSDVFSTFEASASLLQSSQTTEAKDALRLLEILSMLHFSRLPMQIFEDAWKASRRAGMSCELGTLSQWHVFQLPDFLVMIQGDWDSFRLQEAVSLLASLFLITESTQSGSVEISMHSLVHAWTKTRLNSKEQNRVWRRTGAILALSISVTWPWHAYYTQLQAHVQSYCELFTTGIYSLKPHPMIASILFNCGKALTLMQDNTLSLKILKSITDEFSVDVNHPSTQSTELIPLYDLQAENLQNLGKIKEALLLYEQIFSIRKRTLAEDHSLRLLSQHMVARSYLTDGQAEKSVQLFQEIVNIRKQLLFANGFKPSNTQHLFAEGYFAKQSVDMPSDILSKNQLDLLSSEHDLADAYIHNDQEEEAIQLLQSTVNIPKSMLPEDHINRRQAEFTLAKAYFEVERIDNAIELLERIVDIEKATLSKEHLDLLYSQHLLAQAYLANDQTDKAVQLSEHVVNFRKIQLSENHDEILSWQHDLAQAYSKNDQIEKAVSLFEHVVNVRKTTLSENNEDLLKSQHELARVYLVDHQIDKAKQLTKHVINIRKITSGNDHSLLMAQTMLARVYLADGQVEEAIQLLKHIVDASKMTTFTHHKLHIWSQQLLADAYRKNNQTELAVQLLISHHALVSTYKAEGQIWKARNLLKELNKIEETSLDLSTY